MNTDHPTVVEPGVLGDRFDQRLAVDGRVREVDQLKLGQLVPYIFEGVVDRGQKNRLKHAVEFGTDLFYPIVQFRVRTHHGETSHILSIGIRFDEIKSALGGTDRRRAKGGPSAK